MPVYQLTVNGKNEVVEAPEDMPVLWVLRDILGMTGTKFGCGIGQCRSCTVHVDGTAMQSCQMPIADAAGKAITTIEGLGAGKLHALQQAWIEEQVPQCGYCQAGQLMSAAALLASKPKPTEAEIDSAMSANLCRCGTYNRIRRAILRAAGEGS
jgi:isoquinoline 1-oxidoreductase alpha subunit